MSKPMTNPLFDIDCRTENGSLTIRGYEEKNEYNAI